jgi:two-component system phosphate regulon sensor histidine kinase PhoR
VSTLREPDRTAAVRHLPFALAVGAIAVIAVIVAPMTLMSPLFLAGLATAVLVFGLTVAVPWHRLRPAWELVIPALDYAVILLCREGSRDALDVVGILVVFPALWLSNLYRWLGAVAGAVATVAVFTLPHAVNADLPFESREWARIILFPLIVLLLGIHGNIQSQLVESKKRRLEQLTSQLTTALDRSDERKLLLDSVLDAVDVAVIVVDADGREVLLNRVARSIDRTANRSDRPHGAKERIATYREDRVTPYALEDRLAVRGARQEVVTGELLWIGEYPEQTAWLATVRPVTREDGRFFRSVIALHEVTDLVSAVAVKQDFVDSISHELRTPLTSIVGYLDLIRDEVPAAQSRLLSMLDTVERNTDRLAALVRDLVSAGQQGLSVVRSNADLTALVAGCVDAMRPTAATRGIAVQLRLEPVTASIDQTRIGQAIDNLLSNAVKYGRRDGRIAVTLETDAASDTVRLSIADDGVGIAAADLERIFDRFYRSEDAVTGSTPGLGLGLAITHAIVRAHNGRIEARSALGEGTTMTVILPMSHRIG